MTEQGYDVFSAVLIKKIERFQSGHASIWIDSQYATAFQKAAILTMKEKIVADEVSSADLAELAILFPVYEIGKSYLAKEIFFWENAIYEVVQNHTSQADWPPATTYSLYKIHRLAGVVYPWVQPTGAHDAYPVDIIVRHNDLCWKSLVAANVWEPGSNPTLWAQVPCP